MKGYSVLGRLETELSRNLELHNNETWPDWRPTSIEQYWQYVEAVYENYPIFKSMLIACEVLNAPKHFTGDLLIDLYAIRLYKDTHKHFLWAVHGSGTFICFSPNDSVLLRAIVKEYPNLSWFVCSMNGDLRATDNALWAFNTIKGEKSEAPHRT